MVNAKTRSESPLEAGATAKGERKTEGITTFPSMTGNTTKTMCTGEDSDDEDDDGVGDNRDDGDEGDDDTRRC